MEKEADSKKLNRQDLLKEIENFITSHNTCALATADLNGFVRCTAIGFLNSSFKEQGADSRQHLEMD